MGIGVRVRVGVTEVYIFVLRDVRQRLEHKLSARTQLRYSEFDEAVSW